MAGYTVEGFVLVSYEGDGSEDQVSANEGDKLIVVEDFGDGWCDVIKGERSGIFPTAYLDFKGVQPYRSTDGDASAAQGANGATNTFEGEMFSDTGLPPSAIGSAPAVDNSAAMAAAKAEQERQNLLVCFLFYIFFMFLCAKYYDSIIVFIFSSHCYELLNRLPKLKQRQRLHRQKLKLPLSNLKKKERKRSCSNNNLLKRKG